MTGWLLAALLVMSPASASEPTIDGWTPVALRDEIRPDFKIDETGGYQGEPGLVISADQREGLDGYWRKTFDAEGGRHYRFEAFYKTARVTHRKQSVFSRITWLDGKEELVDGPRELRAGLDAPSRDKVRPVYPADRGTDEAGWTEVGDTYRAPENAVQAVVELRLRWAPGGTVTWSQVSLEPTDPPPSRQVRLATVHFRPRGGKSIHDNCEMFVPLIENAARQHADLVVLPEFALSIGLPGTPAERSEVVPGPATEFFADLARKHDLYIVVTLLERAGHLVYNTAALVGPEGYLGKYRKVCLPREAYEKGIAPGSEFPVFDTRFGKVGMMICWDLQFPEVARELAAREAEIIACPIAGGNPQLAKARTIENQIYLVTSTYSTRPNWMKTGVWDQAGRLVAHTEDWGSVVVTEVDLNQRKQWLFLGDLQRRIARERPIVGHRTESSGATHAVIEKP